MCKETIILASQSPRRRELLTMAGLPFEVHVPDVDESCNLPAGEAVAELSRRKAAACLPEYGGRFILAADTLVCLGKESLGKPHSEEEAVHMLRALSGKTHVVYSGLSVIAPDRTIRTAVDSTEVSFCCIPDSEILSYVASGEPLDKAGAYAAQGRASLWITGINGSFSSVIGLPMLLTRKLLLEAGYPLLSAWA